MDLILFSAGCMAFYAFWKLVWKPVILGYYRDKLFDLRDDLRDWASERGQLGDSAYLASRNYINASLRYLEDHSFIGIMSIIYAIDQHPGCAELLKVNISERLHTEDKKLASKIQDVRKGANEVINRYIVLRSFPLCVVMVVLVSISVILYLFRFAIGNILLKTKEALSMRIIVTQAVAACLVFISMSGPANLRHSARQHEVVVAFSDYYK